jgi:hypothetical protein
VKLIGPVVQANIKRAARGEAEHGTEIVRISDRISTGNVEVDIGQPLTLVFGGLSYGGTIGNLFMIADAVSEILDIFEGEFIGETLD